MWYRTAEHTLGAIAYDTGQPYKVVAGVVAALSPRCAWSTNLMWARRLCAAPYAKVSTLNNRRKARAIVRGAEPLDVLRGPKVRAFYRALTGDTSAVVVDLWMARWAGMPDRLTPIQYEHVATRLRREAITLGQAPRDYQALVWCMQRGAAW